MSNHQEASEQVRMVHGIIQQAFETYEASAGYQKMGDAVDSLHAAIRPFLAPPVAQNESKLRQASEALYDYLTEKSTDRLPDDIPNSIWVPFIDALRAPPVAAPTQRPVYADSANEPDALRHFIDRLNEYITQLEYRIDVMRGAVPKTVSAPTQKAVEAARAIEMFHGDQRPAYIERIAAIIQRICFPAPATATEGEDEKLFTWRPFSSAPQDETEFIALRGGRAFVCKRAKYYAKWPHEEGGPTFNYGWTEVRPGALVPLLERENPTHWTPFPARHTATQQKEQKK